MIKRTLLLVLTLLPLVTRAGKINMSTPRRTRAKGRKAALNLQKQHLSVYVGDAFSILPFFKDAQH